MTSSTTSHSAPNSSVVVLDPSGDEDVTSAAATAATANATSDKHASVADSAAPAAPAAVAAPAAAPAPPSAPLPTARGGSSSRTMSILALSLGIASFFFAQSVVVPLAAIVLGVFGLRDEPSGRSFSIWGIVLACVASFGWVVIVAGLALFSLPFLFIAGL